MKTMIRITGALVLGMTSVVTGAAAQTQVKERPPAPSAAKDFTLPARSSFTLPNGMKVTLAPFGATPKLDVQLVVRVGNVDEGPNEVWLSDLMSDLMREGTRTRTNAQINLAAADMGGSVATSVSLDELTVSGSALSEHAAGLISLIAEIGLQPSFPEQEFARIKQNRLRNLALQKSQPGALAAEKFYNVLYPNHSYGRYFPTEAMLQSYTLPQLRDFYNKHVHASRAHLFVAGQFNAAAVERTIRTAFGGWTAGTPVAPIPPQSTTRRAIYIIDRPGAVQSSMYIGGPTIDPSHKDYRALQVTNMLLGGAFGSRITRNIREDKGYTYSPFSQISSRYRNAYWAEIADVTTNVTGASIKEILAEIDRLQAEPPSASELKGVQDNMVGGYIMSGSTRGGMIGLLRSLNLHGLPESYVTQYVRSVYAVSPADVQRVARQYLNDDNFAIVIVGDRKQIEEQVKPFGPIM